MIQKIRYRGIALHTYSQIWVKYLRLSLWKHTLYIKKLYPIPLVIISCNLFAYRDAAVTRVTQSFSRVYNMFA